MGCTRWIGLTAWLGLVGLACGARARDDDDDDDSGGEGEGEGDAGPTPAGQWVAEQVGPVGALDAVGGQSAVAIGPDGFVRVAFCASVELGLDGGLRYAGRLHGEWTLRDWSAGTGVECEGPALFLPGDGSLLTSASARAEWAGGWFLATASGGDEPGPPVEPGAVSAEWAWGFGSAAAAGTPRGATAVTAGAIALHDSASGELRIIEAAGLPTTLDTGCPGTADVSAATDAAGDLVLAWTACRELRFGRRTAGAWSPETIGAPDDAGYAGTSIGVDGQGFAHVIHRHGSTVGHATDASGTWELEPVDGATDATFSAGSVDSNDVVHAAWIDGDGVLHHAARVADSWSAEVVGPATSDCAMATGPNGSIAITYRSGTDLWLAARDLADD